MAKKFYDILPPNIKKEDNNKNSFPKEKKRKKMNFGFKKIAIGFFVFVFIFIAVNHVAFLNAQVIVWPETDDFFYSEEITIDSSIIASDFENRSISGQLFEIKEEEKRTFFSSGKESDGSRAEGILKVYNNYSPSPQSLVENTRFISSDGKLFYSTERITIPGTRTEGGRTIPGEVEVLVRAAETGSDYNIDKTSKFSVPGLQGTALYTAIYAENKDPIKGGYSGEVPLITESDIENAREVLITDLREKAKDKIAKEIADDFIIENELIEEEIIEESFSPGIGENYESFEYSIKLNLKIISFKQSDVEKIIEIALNEETFIFDEGSNSFFPKKEIHKEGLVINFYPSLINFREGRVVLKAESNVSVYPGIDVDNFKKNLSGKKFEELEIIMEDYSQIYNFDLNYWPFWIRTMPSPDRVNIEIKVEER